jgi:hypothetical protein
MPLKKFTSPSKLVQRFTHIMNHVAETHSMSEITPQISLLVLAQGAEIHSLPLTCCRVTYISWICFAIGWILRKVKAWWKGYWGVEAPSDGWRARRLREDEAFLPSGKPNNAINFRSMLLFFSVKIAFNNLYLIYKKSLVRYTSKNNL